MWYAIGIIFFILNLLFNKEEGAPTLDTLKNAIIDGDLPLVKSLIDKGVDINAKDNNGVTPLHYAALNGHKEVVEYLVGKGVDINVKADGGGTPLHNAAYHGHKEVVEYLVGKGANINAEDNNGWTPLHYAAYHGHKEVVEYLVEKGADINTQNNDGRTPKDIAIEEKHKDIVDYLTNVSTNTPKQVIKDTEIHKLIRDGKQQEAKQLILSGKVDLNAKDADGKTPLDLAIELNQGIVSLYIQKNL